MTDKKATRPGVLSWLPIGAVVGLAAGWLYGPSYVLAGLAIGIAGGVGIAVGLSRKGRSS